MYATPGHEADEDTWFEDEVTGWSDHGPADGSLDATPAPAPTRPPPAGRSPVAGAFAIAFGMVFGGGAVVLLAGVGTLVALAIGGAWWAAGGSLPDPTTARGQVIGAPLEASAPAPVAEPDAPAPVAEAPPKRMFYGIPVETAIR